MNKADIIIFPKHNTRFKLDDFFQVEVDSFHSGEFLFLSAKKVKTIISDSIINDIKTFDEYGWIINTYCYNFKSYFKIFVCPYDTNGYVNNYEIRAIFAMENDCDGYSVNSPIEEFLEWMDFKL